MTDTIKTLLLAVVQGLTEFLPVSSSGHLALAQRALNLSSPGARMELFLHVGTLLSVCLFYRRRLAELVGDVLHGRRAGWLYAGWVLLSMVPAGLVYLFAKDPIERLYDAPRAVGALLVLNGILLLCSALADRRDRAAPSGGGLSWGRALAMGVGQALAVLPGISRSGTSITAGRLAGAAPKDATEFSFVMSIPVIAGAALLEFVGAPDADRALPVPLGTALVAAAVGAVVGFAALCAVVRLVSRGRFWVFGLYCLAVGAAALALA